MRLNIRLCLHMFMFQSAHLQLGQNDLKPLALRLWNQEPHTNTI